MVRPRLLVMSPSLARTVRPSPAEFDLLVLDDGRDRDAVLRVHGQGIEAALTSGLERFDAARLDLLPDLKLIATVAAGMSGIDLDAAAARGIAVTNAGDLNAGDVADFAVALILAQVRELFANDAWVRDGRWPAARRPPGRAVGDQRIGIVGMGHIGQAIARRLTPFGCPIGWWGPHPKPDVEWLRYDTLLDLAAWATVLVVAARGDEATRGLIAADTLDALGPDGLIVNVSRGFVIDEAAMIAALRAGRLGGAALDVFEHEPIDGSCWTDVPNVVLAPHVAGGTRAALDRVCAGALDNVRRHFAGAPLRNCVTYAGATARFNPAAS